MFSSSGYSLWIFFGFMKNVAIPKSQIEKALDGKMMFDGSPAAIDDEKFKEIYGKEAERVG